MPEDKAADLLAIFEDYFEGGTAFPSKLPQIAQLKDTSEEPIWILDLKDLNRQHDEVIPEVLKHPRLAIEAAAEAIEKIAPADEGAVPGIETRWGVRLGDPTKIREEEVRISGLRAERIGQLVAVPGIVAQISPVAFKLQTPSLERCFARAAGLGRARLVTTKRSMWQITEVRKWKGPGLGGPGMRGTMLGDPGRRLADAARVPIAPRPQPR